MVLVCEAHAGTLSARMHMHTPSCFECDKTIVVEAGVGRLMVTAAVLMAVPGEGTIDEPALGAMIRSSHPAHLTRNTVSAHAAQYARPCSMMYSLPWTDF